MINLNHDYWWMGQETNQAPPKSKSRELLLH